jgi:hypothetical protein
MPEVRRDHGEKMSEKPLDIKPEMVDAARRLLGLGERATIAAVKEAYRPCGTVIIPMSGAPLIEKAMVTLPN